jgi:hypothetical protein
MPGYSYGYETTLAPAKTDSDRGILLKAIALLARLGQPNSIISLARQTNATGTTYNAFASTAGVRIVGVNGTGTGLTFRRVASPATTIAVASGAAVDLPCAANASEWEVKRTDDSNTQVTLNVHVHNVV